MRLRFSVWNNVLGPGDTAIRTHNHSRVAVAIPHGEINCSVRADAHVAMNTATLRGIAVVGQRAGPVAQAESIATLAGRCADRKRLRAIVDRATLI